MFSRILRRFDPILMFLLLLLLSAGALMFSSAALGLLARGATHTSSVVFNHFVLGIGLGSLSLIIMMTIPYRQFRPWAWYIFGAALVFTALVFVPHIGFEHGGGRRWVDFGFMTVQPSEFLKIASIIAASALFAHLREATSSVRGLTGFFGILLVPALLLALQPDFGTFGVILLSVLAIFIAAGARLRDIGAIGAIAVVALLVLLFTPRYAYVSDRIDTFFNPAAQSAQNEGYQIRQSLIAIGSGGLFGRGIGQGIQKFTYLPEPMGDSVFAVAAEEVGFVGASLLVLLFLLFGLKGYWIASTSSDLFGGLLAVGISTYLVGEAFINIAAMLGLAPLTGIPLTFISQGGSAMLASLLSVGILLNISKNRRV